MSEKTEQPTPQKIRKAREDGQVAHSKDTTQTVLVVALFGYMLGNAEALVRRLAGMILMPAGVLGMEFTQAVNALATQLLREAVSSGATLLVATHKNALLPLFDRIIVLQGGRVAFDGPRDQALEKLGARRTGRDSVQLAESKQ